MGMGLMACPLQPVGSWNFTMVDTMMTDLTFLHLHACDVSIEAQPRGYEYGLWGPSQWRHRDWNGSKVEEDRNGYHAKLRQVFTMSHFGKNCYETHSHSTNFNFALPCLSYSSPLLNPPMLEIQTMLRRYN